MKPIISSLKTIYDVNKTVNDFIFELHKIGLDETKKSDRVYSMYVRDSFNAIKEALDKYKNKINDRQLFTQRNKWDSNDVYLNMNVSFSQTLESLIRNDYDLGNAILTFLNVNHDLVDYENLPISRLKINRYDASMTGIGENIKTRVIKTHNSFKPSDMDEFLD